MKKIFTSPFIGVTIVCVILSVTAFFLFYPVNKKDNTSYLYIDKDDNVDSIAAKLDTICTVPSLAALKTLIRHTDYADRIRTGRFEINDRIGAFALFRHIKNGQQTPIKLTIPSVRTKERLAEELSKRLMFKNEEFLEIMNNQDSCNSFNLDTSTIITIFIPDTYEVYWNVSPHSLLNKMKQHSDAFWNNERLSKAKQLELTPIEVITLASIVDEETANSQEKPRVAGMYFNRLKQSMPLQADPTIKFALKDFAITRIYHNMLFVNSPYNTYKNVGLPPGPIRIPTIDGINAVLNLEHHEYLYMCAKEDFSGTHNFARTYEEHLKNAAAYSKALDERNIGKYKK